MKLLVLPVTLLVWPELLCLEAKSSGEREQT
ncbi:uncharacterized protein METZ01_LOCUS85601 [marine metagenome]|uniref:Uncharacterized protein n=1 Tax=marine metagenome TaxID=408172 RepID=A0A381UZD7_9ZZZZ